MSASAHAESIGQWHNGDPTLQGNPDAADSSNPRLSLHHGAVGVTGRVSVRASTCDVAFASGEKWNRVPKSSRGSSKQLSCLSFAGEFLSEVVSATLYVITFSPIGGICGNTRTATVAFGQQSLEHAAINSGKPRLHCLTRPRSWRAPNASLP